MVYMVAQNVPGEAKPLIKEAESDIAEMMKVGSNDTLNIFFELHGDGVPQRCHVRGRDAKRVHEPMDPDDATNGKALTRFIRWAIDSVDHVQEDASLLVLWGHAYRFGLGATRTSRGIDAIDFAELARVLRDAQEELRKKYRGARPPKLDLVGFDACDISTVEMAVQLSEFAEYMLSSQVGEPLPGWPYQRILDRLARPKGELMGPAEFGTYAVRRYCEHYSAADQAVSLTLLDLSRAQELNDATEALARTLAVAMDADSHTLDLVPDLLSRSQTQIAPSKPFVDVVDLCINLLRYSSNDDVRAAAKYLGNLVVSPGPVEAGHSANGAGRPVVVEHGYNATLTAGLHGLSLYAPSVALNAHDWMAAWSWYEKFAFARRTLWNDLVHALVQPA